MERPDDPDTRSATIAVLGLGPMGSAVARAVAAAGHSVAAWNRTERTLGEHGLDDVARLEIVGTPQEAATGADLIVICVRDHDASRAVVERIAHEAKSAVVINISTGTPAQASESAHHASELDLRYVTGAVMVPTPMVGTDDCFVLYAGSSEAIGAAETFFAALGGGSDVVGTDHTVPPALDLAMLDIYFSGM